MAGAKAYFCDVDQHMIEDSYCPGGLRRKAINLLHQKCIPEAQVYATLAAAQEQYTANRLKALELLYGDTIPDENHSVTDELKEIWDGE